MVLTRRTVRPETSIRDNPTRVVGLIFAIVSLASSWPRSTRPSCRPLCRRSRRISRLRSTGAAWTITVYALGQVLVMPLAGRMSDQFGRKKVFLVAAVIFTSASLACGLVGDIQWLLVLRGVQALGGGAFMPSATGIVSDHFGDSRDRALGMFTSIFPIGGIVGPILGGIFRRLLDVARDLSDQCADRHCLGGAGNSVSFPNPRPVPRIAWTSRASR